MPRKKTICIEDGCTTPTHGQRCRLHRYESSRKWENEGDAQRDHAYRYKYGLTLEEVDSLIVVFRGKCGICRSLLTANLKKKGQPLSAVVVDHNHKTGNVRGLLCGGCNKGIGFLKEDPEILRRAMEWCE